MAVTERRRLMLAALGYRVRWHGGLSRWVTTHDHTFFGTGRWHADEGAAWDACDEHLATALTWHGQPPITIAQESVLADIKCLVVA